MIEGAWAAARDARPAAAGAAAVQEHSPSVRYFKVLNTPRTYDKKTLNWALGQEFLKAYIGIPYIRD